ncbi:hypothetical protein TWF694_003641 [Orbilia ellipsospora]|uniref:NADH dehydrogenase [ubiquinone] 1 alpha subcomplex subunit n=1 Tax=Orbilia ellipsospora TaxID=2528407 RepID=A0AAV9X197_9PEZI
MSVSPQVSSYILPHLSPFKRLYYRWKSIRLPWRKRYFIGMDLEGNTFWEFRDRLVASRARRIMDFRGGVHSLANYSEFRVDPQWHQWLRATRYEPPTVAELQAEVTRREVMVERARLADERWAKGGSYLRRPGEEEVRRLQQSAERTEASDGRFIASTSESTGGATAEDAIAGIEGASEGRVDAVGKGGKGETTVEGMREMLRVEREKRGKGRPEGPGESFQPGEWNPKANPER